MKKSILILLCAFLAAGNLFAQKDYEADWLYRWSYGMLTPIPAKTDPALSFRSWNNEWSFGLVKAAIRPAHNHFKIEAGIDFNFLSMGSTKPIRYKKSGSELVIEELRSGVDFKRSNLRVMQIRVPLSVGVMTFKDFGVMAGVAADFNVYAWSKAVYKENNSKVRLRDKGFRTKPLGCDLFVEARFDWVSIYGKYSPTVVLDPSYGPTFATWSVGVVMNID